MKDRHIEVYDDYRDNPQHGGCEIARWLGITWRDGKYTPMHVGFDTPAEAGCHHIWSVGMRPNVRSNLVRISPEAHRLVHNGTKGEPITIRLACICAKLIKRNEIGEPAEFDLDVMKEVSGQHVAGWVERQNFMRGWEADLRDRCLALLGEESNRVLRR